MSKHDFSAKKTEDRSDELLSSEAFTPERSGLSKEIKLSLAAIVVLFGVLGYALYGHFFGAEDGSIETSVAAAATEDETPSTDPVAVTVTTDRSTDSDTTATTESRWGSTARREQPSTSQSGASSRFSYMPSTAGITSAAPAPMPETTPDQNSAYSGGSPMETSTAARSSDATADTSAYDGQTRDPFQGRTAQNTVGSYMSQRQTDGYSSQSQTGGRSVQTYGQSTAGPAYPNWQSDSRPLAPATEPGTAVVSSDTDTTSSARFSPSTTVPNQTSKQEDLPDDAAPESSVRIQSTPQYSTDSHGYVKSSTHGYTGGTASTQIESRSSSPSYNDYNASSQSSDTPASAGFSTVATPSNSNQYGFSDAARSDGKYIIQPNDSYWSISKKLYGTGSYFKALAQHNRTAFPDSNQLGVGKEIETPDVSELERLYPDLCPKPEHRDAIKHRRLAAGKIDRSAGATVYVVQEGDTLFDIARYELGKAARWSEIYKLNRDRLGKGFDYLTPGLELVMPSESVSSAQPAGTATQRAGSLR